MKDLFDISGRGAMVTEAVGIGFDLGILKISGNRIADFP